MNIQLTFNDKIVATTLANYNPQLDNIISFLDYVCDVIDGTNDCTFKISGFGDKEWPVDLDCDLPIYLEQLPFAIKSLKENIQFQIDFYEQGIERKLSFYPINRKEWEIVCNANLHNGWLPNPNSIKINTDLLKEMLDISLRNFLEYIKLLDLGSWNEVVLEWKNGNFNW